MRTARWSSASGVLSVGLLFAGFAVAGNAPSGAASIPRVVAFYGGHITRQTLSGVFLGLGALLFLLFAAAFTTRLGQGLGAAPSASALCPIGAGILAVGLSIYAGLSISIADVVGQVDGSVVQTLNVLADDAVFIFLVTVGTSTFLIGAAAAVFSTASLPRWLGWLAIVLAVVGAIPSHVLGGSLDHIGIIAFAGLGVWTAIVATLLATTNAATADR